MAWTLWKSGALALLASLGCLPGSSASADEVTPTGTMFQFSPARQDSTALHADLPPTALRGGIYVIGDSISEGVPYVAVAAEHGIKAQTRSSVSWTIQFHRESTQWPGSTVPSFTDAARSDAKAVVVELGSNDVACFRYEPQWCARPPRGEDPQYPAWLAAAKARVTEQFRLALSELWSAGKCVVWLGPRHPRLEWALQPSDVDWFNMMLAAQDGVYDADYSQFAASDPRLAADFAQADTDGIHPTTVAGRRAVAELAVDTAIRACAPESGTGDDQRVHSSTSPATPTAPATVPRAPALPTTPQRAPAAPASVRLSVPRVQFLTHRVIRLRVRTSRALKLRLVIRHGRHQLLHASRSLSAGTTSVHLTLTAEELAFARRHAGSYEVVADGGRERTVGHLRLVA